MKNDYLRLSKSILRELKQTEKDKSRKAALDDAMFYIDRGAVLDDMRIQEAKMIGVRNPAFDGDMVGWLDDDFDDFDDDDDKKKK